MIPRMIGEKVCRDLKPLSIKKVIKDTIVLSGGGILFEDLIGRLPHKHSNLFKNPDMLESYIQSMPLIKIIKYQTSNGIKRFVYIPVKD
jgi:hypothetical protein